MKPSVKYGLILAAVLIAFSLAAYAAGLDKNETMQMLTGFINFVISAIIVFLGIKEQRDVFGNGYITFGKGFSTGFMICLIGGLVSSVYTYMYFSFINPGMITHIRMKQEEEMLKSGMSDEMVANMAGKMEFMTTPLMMAVFSIIMMVILGLILSLICSAILKKEDPSAQIS